MRPSWIIRSCFKIKEGRKGRREGERKTERGREKKTSAGSERGERGDQAATPACSVHTLAGVVWRQEDEGLFQEGMVSWDHPREVGGGCGGNNMLSISPHRNSSQCRGWGEGKVIRVHREIRGHCTDEVSKGRTARSLGFYRLSNFKCQPEKPGCRVVAQCSAWVHWLEQDAQSRQTGAGLPGSSS